MYYAVPAFIFSYLGTAFLFSCLFHIFTTAATAVAIAVAATLFGCIRLHCWTKYYSRRYNDISASYELRVLIMNDFVISSFFFFLCVTWMNYVLDGSICLILIVALVSHLGGWPGVTLPILTNLKRWQMRKFVKIGKVPYFWPTTLLDLLLVRARFSDFVPESVNFEIENVKILVLVMNSITNDDVRMSVSRSVSRSNTFLFASFFTSKATGYIQ
jgi:hypothetical protein